MTFAAHDVRPIGAGRGRSDRLVLAGLALSMLLAALGTSMANVALPALARAFDAPFQHVQWVVIAYLLAVTTLIVGVGRLSDMMGRRNLLLIGIALFTSGSAVAGFSPALWVLIAARGLQGSGAAVMMAVTLATVGVVVPRDRTGSAMGLLGAASAIGTALGPSLGGVLIAGFGWQAIFLAMVPFGVLALVLTRLSFPSDEPRSEAAGSDFDTRGMLLLAATLAAYSLAMTVGRGDFGPLNAALLLAALLGGGLFIIAETRAAAPLVRLTMFRSPVLSAGLGTSALVSTVMMTTLVVGPFYLSSGLGLGTGSVGLVMSVGPVVAALAGVPAGRIVDRLGAERMTVVGLLGIVAGTLSLALVPMGFGVIGYIAPMGAATAGYALFQAANTTAVMRDARSDQRGGGLRNAQPVAQSRSHHRRIGHGSDVRLRHGCRRRRSGDPRGGVNGNADHLRGGFTAGRRRVGNQGLLPPDSPGGKGVLSGV
jgi:MFS family permease